MRSYFDSSFLRYRSRLVTVTFLAAAFLLLAGARLMPRFLQDLTAGDPLNQVFYTTVSFFGVSIDVPRPTQEAQAELQKYVALPPGERPQPPGQQGSALQRGRRRSFTSCWPSGTSEHPKLFAWLTPR